MGSALARLVVITAVLPLSAAYAQSTDAQAPPDSNPRAAEVSQDHPGFIARMRGWADRHQLVERLSGDVDGWYPRLGGMTRGSGFGLGPGYRFHINDILVDVSGAYSLKNYKAVDAKLRWWHGYDERLELWTHYRYEDFPQEDFFGRGMASSPDARTSYDFSSSDFAGTALFKATSWLQIGTTVGYVSPTVGPGADEQFPSIEALFNDADAPGLTTQPDFLHSTFFADVDYRDEPGNPRSGGFYHAAFAVWDDRNLQQYDFRRFDLNFQQFHSLVSDKSHVISGRLGLAFVNNETGHRVPFYFLPYVGGVDTIRSLHEFRFKDENAIWMSLEYRWVPLKYVSFATFVDAGKVSSDYEDVATSGFKRGYGFGVRVHTRTQTFARIDVGTGGGEGWKVFLKLGPKL
jgi:outer membrane protein assembly factor BamA